MNDLDVEVGKYSDFNSDYVNGFSFNEFDFVGYYDYIEIKNCKFDNCKFYNGKFQGLDISNSLFSLCNFSNVKLNDRSYEKITFNNCNLVGIDFSGSYLDYVEFMEPINYDHQYSEKTF